MMQILVTGGGGFLGTFVIKELLKRSDFLVSNFSRHHYFHLEDLGVPNIKGDLTKIEDIERALLKGQFEVVIHLAADTEEWGREKNHHEVNFLGTKNLLEVSRRMGVKKFLTATPANLFLQGEAFFQATEEMTYPEKYLNTYFESKANAERLVLQNNDSDFLTCSLRFPPLWGMGDNKVIPPLVQRARQGQLEILGDGENLIDLLYVENAAYAFASCLNHLTTQSKIGGESYFITEKNPIKCWDFVNKILNFYEMPSLKNFHPLRSADKKAWMLEKFYHLLGIKKPYPPLTRSFVQMWGNTHFFSSEKSREHFQFFPPLSLEEGLQRTFSQREKIRLQFSEQEAK